MIDHCWADLLPHPWPCCVVHHIQWDIMKEQSSHCLWAPDDVLLPLEEKSTMEIFHSPGRFSLHAIGIYHNTLRPRQNGWDFADDIFKRIFFNGNVWVSIKMSHKFVPKGPINNIPALVQIMAWCRPGDKPLSEPRMVRLPTLICVTRPNELNISSAPIQVIQYKSPRARKFLFGNLQYLIAFTICVYMRYVKKTLCIYTWTSFPSYAGI